MVKFSAVLVFVLSFLSPQLLFALPISIESQVADGLWRPGHAAEALQGQPVSLRVPEVESATIRWFQIVPNIDIRYNNAVWPWLPKAYTWKGFDQIEYNRVPLEQFDGQWAVPVFLAKGSDEIAGLPQTRSDSLLAYFKRRLWDANTGANSFGASDLGSFWFQAQISKEGRTYQSPGIESRDNRGLSPEVFRVSIRQKNDLLGNLTAYLNVPAVFGSTPYQVRNYIGVDCADVLMAAYCKTNNLPIAKDYNVAMLTRKFKTLVKSTIDNGEVVGTIRWQKEVRPGDFIAVKYPSGRQYQHIGALYSDQNANGIFDGDDLILHAGPDPLHFSKVNAGAFDGTILILRAE